MRVSAVQMNATPDKPGNLDLAGRLIRAAAADGGELIVLPEMFALFGDRGVLEKGAEDLEGPTILWARQTARELGIWLVAGSFMERVSHEAKCYNTSCLVDPEGEVQAVYRKIHIFDNDVPGAVFKESERIMPGHDVVVGSVNEFKIGMSICYDLRFPELFRILALRDARVIVLPSAFTERTGRDHWETLIRARAIENQVFMIAANQIGSTPGGMRWYGHSMIVDPWGTVLAQTPDEASCITCDLDFNSQDVMRQQLPSLANRQPKAYQWPQKKIGPMLAR